MSARAAAHPARFLDIILCNMTILTTRATLFLIVWSILFALPNCAQTPDKQDNKNAEKVKVAVERSISATDVLKRVASLPEGNGIPRDIAEKANLIGVIPDAFQLSLLFARGVRGYGLTSVRRDDTWSLPSYFFFGRSTGFDMSSVGSKRFDLVLVVVNANLDPPKKKDKTAGKPKDKSNDKDKPQPYLYAFADGTLKPIAIKTGFFSSLLGAQTNVLHDNALNKAVYAAKGDDILLGNFDTARQLPSEVNVFRDSLNEAFPTKK
jgi:hypothetical protein